MASTFYETVGHKPIDQTYSSSMREADTNRKRPYRKPRLMGEKRKRRGGRARLGRMRRGNTNYIVADHERKRAEDVAVSRCIHSRIYICVGHRFKPIMGWFAPVPRLRLPTCKSLPLICYCGNLRGACTTAGIAGSRVSAYLRNISPRATSRLRSLSSSADRQQFQPERGPGLLRG
jgi:hypothetical protein